MTHQATTIVSHYFQITYSRFVFLVLESRVKIMTSYLAWCINRLIWLIDPRCWPHSRTSVRPSFRPYVSPSQNFKIKNCGLGEWIFLSCMTLFSKWILFNRRPRCIRSKEKRRSKPASKPVDALHLRCAGVCSKPLLQSILKFANSDEEGLRKVWGRFEEGLI